MQVCWTGCDAECGGYRPADRLLHSRHARRRGAGRDARARLPGTPAGERHPAAGSGGRLRQELRPAALPALSRRRAGRNGTRRARPAGAARARPRRPRRHAGRSGDHRPDPRRPGGHRDRGGRRRRHGHRVLGAIPVPARTSGGQRTPRPGGHGHRKRRRQGRASGPYHGVLFTVWPAGRPDGAKPRPARRDGSPTSMSRHHGRPGSSTPSAPGVSSARPACCCGLLRTARRRRAGRRAVRAAGVMAPRPPGTPPGTSHRRGRRRRLHRHPARLRPGRGWPAGGELHHHDPAARLRACRRTAAGRRRRARRGASPDRAGGPRRDLPAPVRHADDRRRDAPGRPGQPAGQARSSGSARRHCATCRRC